MGYWQRAYTERVIRTGVEKQDSSARAEQGVGEGRKWEAREGAGVQGILPLVYEVSKAGWVSRRSKY